MLRVMKAVPQMESFIKEVCLLVQEVSSRESHQSVIGIDVFFTYIFIGYYSHPKAMDSR